MRIHNWVMPKINLVFFLLFTLPLLSCGRADTLHKLKPPAVAYDSQNPTWENGIGNLVKERCATCHSPQRNQVAPKGRGALEVNFLTKSEFDSLSASNKSTILGKGRKGVETMPPNYADPLSEDEKAALVKYIDIVRSK